MAIIESKRAVSPDPSSLLGYSKPIRDVITVLRGLVPKDGVLPGKNQKQHDSFVRPAKEAMERYHNLYAAIFIGARHRLDDLCHTKYPSQEPDAVSDRKIVDMVAGEIEKKRRKDETARHLFRIEIQGWLRAIDDKDHRRFVMACGHYFILEPDVYWEKALIVDPIVDRLVERGGESVYDTPATRVTRKLRGLDNLGEARRHIDSTLIALDAKYRALSELDWEIQAKRRLF